MTKIPYASIPDPNANSHQSLVKFVTRALAIGLALAAGIALFLAISGRGIGVGELKPPVLEIATVAPTTNFQWTFKTLAGKSVKLSEFQGKPIVLNIWASWCPPCVKEMPSFAKLAQNPALKEKGVAVLCISIDEDAADFKRFVADHSWKLTYLRAESRPPAFQTEFIPATFVIAPDGRIVATTVGPAVWDDPSVVDFLVNLK